MSQYFPKPYGYSSGTINTELDLCEYAAKDYLKVATGVDTSNLTPKFNIASLKVKVDKIDIDKLKTVLADLCKLSNVVDNNFVLKTV